MWTRKYYDLTCIQYPPFNISFDPYLKPNECITIRYTATRRTSLSLRSPVATGGLFWSLDNGFDETKGEPINPLPASTHTDYRIDPYKSIVQGETAYITIRGFTDRPLTGWEILLLAEILPNKDYIVTVMEEARENYSATEDWPMRIRMGYETHIFPIKFACNCHVDFYSAVADRAAVTESIKPIGDFGIPTSGIISSDTSLGAIGYTGAQFDAVKNKQYYLYVYYRWDINYTPDDLKIRMTISPTNREEIVQRGMQWGYVTDYDGNEQGYTYCIGVIPDTGLLPPNYKGYDNWTSTGTDDAWTHNSHPGLYQPVKMMWCSDTDINLDTDYHHYKWAKFIGWYSDPQHQNLISTDISIMHIFTDPDERLYGLVELTDEPFNWEEPVESGAPFRIKANEWNQFICYANSRLIDNGSEGAWYTAYHMKGDRPVAANFMEIKELLDGASTPLSPTELHSGDYIMAEYYQNILTEARSI